MSARPAHCRPPGWVLALLASFVVAVPPSAQDRSTKLNGPIVLGTVGDVHEYRYSPDGSRIFYLADQEGPHTPGLFVVSADGSGTAVQLNTGGEVREFELTSDGATVVYSADQDTPGLFELFRLDLEEG